MREPTVTIRCSERLARRLGAVEGTWQDANETRWLTPGGCHFGNRAFYMLPLDAPLGVSLIWPVIEPPERGFYLEP